MGRLCRPRGDGKVPSRSTCPVASRAPRRTRHACLAGHTAANWARGKGRGWHRGCCGSGTMRLALLLLLASTLAFADQEHVRDDIVDLRHDRWPNRRVFLGWTADNRAVIHVVSCGTYDGSGAPFCSSSLEVFGPSKR